MIFPIGDEQVQGGHKPIFSYSFLVLNVLLFLVQLTVPSFNACEFGTIPNEILRGENYHTLITSMFMHGGWMHLIGNMVFLWIFADNIEATIGNFNFFLFYMLGGLVASGASIMMSGGSAELLQSCCEYCSRVTPGEGCSIPANCPGSIPGVGASGAISAVMGAYMVMFPRSKVKILVLVFFSTFQIAAIFFLGFWIGQQIFSAFADFGPSVTGGVAWWAHIGGFVFGLLAGLLARMSHKPQESGPSRQMSPKDFV